MLPTHPQLYLNLAEVYQGAKRPDKAIKVLEAGMVNAGPDFRIRRAREKIGIRQKPSLPFLRRDHILNRLVGRWRHAVSTHLKTLAKTMYLEDHRCS